MRLLRQALIVALLSAAWPALAWAQLAPAAPPVGPRPAAAAAAKLLSGPYIVGLTSEGGTVCWQTTAFAPGAARVKSDAADWQETAEEKPAQFHAVALTHLAAGTEYQVEVSSAGEKLGVLRFRTVPQIADHFTFYVYGDSRSFPADHRRIADGILAEAERRKEFTFVLHTGDLAEDPAKANTDADCTAEQFFMPAAALLRRLPLVAVRGNHENHGHPDLFLHYFPAPARPAEAAGGDDQLIDYGSVRLIVLDKYAPRDALEARLKWVAARLGEAQDRWRIVAFHEPLYSSGAHGSALSFRAELEPVLVASKVHLVIAGHDHDYERTKPMQGIVHIVSGGGGAPLYDFQPGHSGDWSAKFVKTHHFETVAVTPEKLTVQAWRPKEKGDGFEEFDRVEIGKDGGWPGAK